jgi:hypothetical protein
MMTLLKEIGAELIGMFLADSRLALGVLAVIAAAAALVDVAGADPLLGGAVLLVGCALVLIEAVRRYDPAS